jgi:3-deoxy-D-manno-octulosonic-acid transferase
VAFLYNLSIRFYFLFIFIASLFNKKAKLWINGRKGIFEQIEKKVKKEDNIIWFHCASLGEFEQGRPVIEKLEQDSKTKILITFFSPSGYEVRNKYAGADFVFYLPIDTPANAKRFISLINPVAVFFVKYEFWFNYIREVKNIDIPFFVISANFRKNQHFFKWYGGWFRKQLMGISHIFVQNKESQQLLNNVGINQVTVSGDTRFDRVTDITKQVKDFPIIKKFCTGYDVFITGSSWQPDEELITKLINSEKTNYKFIIAPHLVDKPHIASLVDKIKKGHVVLYSEADEDNVMYAKVLVIDCIGILSHVYRYGKIAYIGGGFGSGIHNILEAATFGMPVIFGPKYHKFREAIDLIKAKGAFSISNEAELMNIVLKFCNEPEYLRHAADIAKNFVQSNIGATNIILKETEKYF